MNIGELIKTEISKKGYSQKDFAKLIGKSTTALSQIINGHYNPNPKTLKTICDVLEIEIKYYTVDISNIKRKRKIPKPPPVHKITKKKIKLCPGCNVKSKWDHICHGKNCDCKNAQCQYMQGKLTYDDLMSKIRINSNQ